LVLVGSGNLTVAFDETEDDIYALLGRVSDTRKRFEDSLGRLGKYMDEVAVKQQLDNLGAILVQIKSGIDSIMATKDQINNIRSTVTIIFAIFPFALLLLAFVFHKCKQNCLLATILLIGSLAVIIIVIVMALHFAIGTVENDICVEFQRQNGLLALFREKASLGFEGLGVVASSAVPNVLSEICSQFTQLCNYDGQTCDDSNGCSQNTVDAIINSSTIYDNGTYISIPLCVTTCSTDDLRAKAQNVLDIRDDLVEMTGIIDDIYQLLYDIISGQVITTFFSNFCSNVGNSLTLMYTGCAFLSVSIIGGVSILVWLSWK